MTIQEEKTEALVLNSLPYLRGSCILKVFTRENGLIGLIGSAKHTSLLSSSLITVEFVYRKKKSDLYSILDLSILSHHFELRKSYEHLSSASEIARCILSSQFPGKPATLMYDLMQIYLRKIPSFKDPFILAASFAMKLLQYEGLIHLSPTCSKCPKAAAFLVQGEALCLQDAPLGGFFFTEEEWSKLLLLTYSKSFAELETLSLPPPFIKRLFDLFQSLASHFKNS